jgi:hypothetical protein
MNEPRRWRDSGDAPDDLRKMFAAGRPTRAMPAATRRRMARSLLGPIAGFAALATWKSVAVAAVLGVAATAGVVATVHLVATESAAPEAPASGVPSRPAKRPATASSPVAVPAPLSLPTATPTPGATATPPPNSSSPRLAAPLAASPTSSAPPASSSDTLSSELALLDLARERYEAHPEETLAVLGEHAQRFPTGKLALERELLALDALKKLGRTSEEHARADKLLRSVRGTLFESRVLAHATTEAP